MTRTSLTRMSSSRRAPMVPDHAARRGRLLVAGLVERPQHLRQLLQHAGFLHCPSTRHAAAAQDAPLPVSPLARRERPLEGERSHAHRQGQASSPWQGHLEADRERRQPRRLDRLDELHLAPTTADQATNAAHAAGLTCRQGRYEDSRSRRAVALSVLRLAARALTNSPDCRPLSKLDSAQAGGVEAEARSRRSS